MNKMEKESNRKSNIELLRILAMIMIIAHHYCLYGEWNKTPGLSLNNAILDFLIIGGKIGVAIFILIAGYFGIKSEFNFKKLLKLILQVVFYTVIFGLINILINGWIGLKGFIKMCLPITFSVYWFMTAYCILYLVSPYINKLFNNLKKKEVEKLLIIMGILSCGIVITLLHVNRGINNLFVFVFLYILGAYISTYYKEKKFKYSLVVAIISYLLIFATQLIFEVKFTNYMDHFISLYSLPTIMCSVMLVLHFKDINIQSTAINIIASATFGVYLIHENTYVRPFLWEKILKNSLFYNKPILILHALGSIAITYIICTIIELLRKYIIERNLLPLVYKAYDKLVTKIKQTKLYKKWEVV